MANVFSVILICIILNSISHFLAGDIKQLSRFPSGGYSDESTIVYLQHPCVVLTALEVCQNKKKTPVSCLLDVVFTFKLYRTVVFFL